MRSLPCAIVLLLAALVHADDTVYQYAVASTDPNGKPVTAYCWVPPAAPRIRGVLVGGQVLFEPTFAALPAIRAACADQQLAMVFFQGHLDAVFDTAKGSGDRLLKALADLATASGHPELAVAPFMPYGHSVGSVFASNVLFWKPERCFACLTFKGGFGVNGRPLASVAGIPLLHVQGRFEEFGPGPSGALTGDETRETGGRTAIESLSKHRAEEPRLLLGLLVEEGATHFALSDRVAERIAAFIAAAAKARIPDWPVTASEPPTLIAVDPASGALSDRDVFAPRAPAAAFAAYTGDKTQSFWHPDATIAAAADAFHAGALTHKPQFVSFADEKGNPIGVGTDMRLKLKPTWNGADTFTVAGAFWTTVPKRYPPVEGAVGHAEGPIRFRVFGGPIEQVGDNVFRVTMDDRRGTRGRCFVMAYHPGDATWRYAEQPGRVNVPERLTAGEAQTITFAELGTVPRSALPLALKATSDKGLPVRFHVDHGPAVVRDGKLELADLPAKAVWPLTIEVVAWQFGSAVAPQVQTAEPVHRVLHVTE